MTRETIIEIIERAFERELHWEAKATDELFELIEQEKKEQAKEIFRAIRGCEHHSVLRQEEHSEWWESVWTASELIPIAKEYGVEL